MPREPEKTQGPPSACLWPVGHRGAEALRQRLSGVLHRRGRGEEQRHVDEWLKEERLHRQLERERPGAAGHRDFPPRFRAVVRTLLLCARRPDCVVAKLPADALLHIVSVLAWAPGQC